jgi:hypothetical protein
MKHPSNLSLYERIVFMQPRVGCASRYSQPPTAVSNVYPASLCVPSPEGKYALFLELDQVNPELRKLWSRIEHESRDPDVYFARLELTAIPSVSGRYFGMMQVRATLSRTLWLYSYANLPFAGASKGARVFGKPGSLARYRLERVTFVSGWKAHE